MGADESVPEPPPPSHGEFSKQEVKQLLVLSFVSDDVYYVHLNITD